MKTSTTPSPTTARRRSQRTQAFKHALWKTALVLRGQRYRITQIRRIVLTALEHLHIPGDARVMEVRCKTSGTGLVVAIAWEHSLPPLETAALSRYIVSKIQAITGLSYVQQDVFFEPYLPPQAEITEKHTSSWWLRERIHRLTNSVRTSHQRSADSSDGAEEHPQTVPQSAHGLHSHVRSHSKGHLKPGEAAAMVAEFRKRLHQSRGGSTTTRKNGAAGHPQDAKDEDAIIDGFLTVHADLAAHPEPAVEAAR